MELHASVLRSSDDWPRSALSTAVRSGTGPDRAIRVLDAGDNYVLLIALILAERNRANGTDWRLKIKNAELLLFTGRNLLIAGELVPCNLIHRSGVQENVIPIDAFDCP